LETHGPFVCRLFDRNNRLLSGRSLLHSARKGRFAFFGRGSVKFNATGSLHPDFVLEDPQFMHMILPAAGTCPASTTPIYRVFSNRISANHRYMTDSAIRDRMLGQGWLAKGDGPDRVVMCGPLN
jgi:hypothetical protein